MKVKITGEDEEFLKSLAGQIGCTPKLAADMIHEGVEVMKAILRGDDPTTLLKQLNKDDVALWRARTRRSQPRPAYTYLDILNNL